MTSTRVNKRLRLGLALLASGIAFSAAAPAAAQAGYGVYQEDPGSALSRHLKALAASPRNLGALMGAGKAALELGDAQAAATFYARAEEIAPRDGRVKAGLGSAFLAMEQPQAALKFFADARLLGAPEGEYAADRGLAHDLTGNPAQAQLDYALAMRTRDTAEVRRRLALSKAISGDRAGALAIVDEQIRRQDPAGWRIRAFVLALTGDAAGATEAVRAVMPGQAAAMQPFLARLPLLRPADRAMAVHFGHFPNAALAQAVPAPQQQYAGAAPARTPAATGRSTAQPVTRPAPAPSSPRVATTPSRPAQPGSSSGPSYAERRDLLRGAGTVRRRVEAQPVQQPAQRSSVAQANDPIARASVARPVQTYVPPVQAPAAAAPATTPVRLADAAPASRPVQGPPSDLGQPVALPANTVPQGGPVNPLPQAAAPAQAGQRGAAAGVPAAAASQPVTAPVGIAAVTPPPSAAAADTVPIAPTVASPTVARPGAAATGLASIAATIRSLPDQEVEAKEAPKPAAPPAPSRHWVQIASAPEALADSEFRRLRGKAPALLGSLSGWKAALGANHRVLVGPFRNRAEAQALVNALANANIAALPWTSTEGQEIVKLAAK